MIIKLRNTTIVVANVQYERSNQIQKFKSFDETEAAVMIVISVTILHWI